MLIFVEFNFTGGERLSERWYNGRMEDNFGRAIDYLRLSVTDLCNQRCVYCMPEDGVEKLPHSDILSVEETVEIARAAAALGMRKVRLTGGEPLVRRGIDLIAEGVAAIPGIREVCVTTNGTLLAEPFAGARTGNGGRGAAPGKLPSHGRTDAPGAGAASATSGARTYARMLADAGVSRVNISLDSLDAAEYARITRGGDLAAALRGVDAAIDAGLTPIKLNAVLAYGLDSGRIERLAALTKNPGIHVRFIELMPIGRSASWAQGKFVPGAAVLQALPGLEPVGADGVAEIYRLPGAEGTIGVIHPISRHFCPICNRVRVTADGRLKPCLHSDKEVALKGLHGEELELAMRLGIEGKPARHRLDKEKVSASRRGMNAIGG